MRRQIRESVMVFIVIYISVSLGFIILSMIGSFLDDFIISIDETLESGRISGICAFPVALILSVVYYFRGRL